MDARTTESIARRLQSRLKAALALPREEFAGRGIVTCAGGPRMFTNAYVLIHVLRRHLGCLLPIEVWHFGQAELSPRMASLLRELDAQPVDACAAMCQRPPQFTNPWQLKPYAIMWSQFREVLYLDADQVPARDPTGLFTWPQFLEKGAVFWPDVMDLPPDNPIWKICQLPQRRAVSVESGQILVDKARHRAGLDMTLALNEEAHVLYKSIYGDKDTFLLGAMMSGGEIAMIPGRPKTDLPWCLYQTDFAGDVLFQHRTGAKWTYKGPQQKLPNFLHHEACENALAELRRKWNGRVFHAPGQTAAKDLFDRIYRLTRPGEEVRLLQFLPDGEIAAESLLEPMNWYCEDVAGAVSLVLDSGLDKPLRFAAAKNDVWQAGDVLLVPADGPGEQNLMNLLRELVAATGFPGPVSKSAWSELQAALSLLSRRKSDLRGNVLAIAAEQGPGPTRKMLEELGNALGSTEVSPPDAIAFSDWNVITAHYTRKLPE